MPTETFDAIVIGAGQAGPALAARCSKEGLKTAVIERSNGITSAAPASMSAACRPRRWWRVRGQSARRSAALSSVSTSVRCASTWRV
jgi:flavin-dependent dehydrogenase